MPAILRLTGTGVNAVGGRRGGRGKRAGYFVGLLKILHFGNAFFN